MIGWLQISRTSICSSLDFPVLIHSSVESPCIDSLMVDFPMYILIRSSFGCPGSGSFVICMIVPNLIRSLFVIRLKMVVERTHLPFQCKFSFLYLLGSYSPLFNRSRLFKTR